jgi:matrixin
MKRWHTFTLLFVHFLALIFILNVYVTLSNILYPKSTILQNHSTHRILYLDRNFTNEEILVITEAVLDWEEKTHHVISIDIVILPTTDSLDLKDGVIVNKFNSDNYTVINNSGVIGYYQENEGNNTIVLVTDRLADYKTFRQCILHEIGHMLGLYHNSNADTLMYPYIEYASYDITQEDVDNFCSIYDCP